MAEVAIKNGNTHRNPMMVLAERFDALESEARGRLLKVIGAGNDALHGIDEKLAKVSKDDWTVDGLRKRLDGLRARAEELRTTAVRRMSEMPATAVTRLASTTRVPVQNLSRELDRLAKMIEPPKEIPAAVAAAAAPVVEAAKKAKKAIEA
ncbi:MAG: hypothetical protein QM767_12440 [Anaeromyxobacter sp.]